jgi:hypothetical protein
MLKRQALLSFQGLSSGQRRGSLGYLLLFPYSLTTTITHPILKRYLIGFVRNLCVHDFFVRQKGVECLLVGGEKGKKGFPFPLIELEEHVIRRRIGFLPVFSRKNIPCAAFSARAVSRI